jgi:4-hydroxy-tetrahydrodipicolinate synthase
MSPTPSAREASFPAFASQLSSRDLRGVIVALVTPMTTTGAIDQASFISLVDWLLDERVDGFVLNGTTGESPTVRWPEVERLLAVLRERVRGRVPVLLGTGTYDTAESVERTERARALGADGALAVVPYYSRPTPAGVIEHFRRIAAVGLPTVAYHIPYRTGVTLDLPTLRALLAIPGVIGLKESSGGLANITALAADGAGARALLCGEDALFAGALAAGAAGAILASANLVPGAFAEMHRASREGRPLAARATAARLRPLIEALFAESSPAPLKWALAQQGRIASASLRLPLVAISAALAERLRVLAVPLASPRGPQPPEAHDGELEQLARRFAAQDIAAKEWTHTAHLTMGAWHVHHLGPDQALVRLREGIRRLNQAHGTAETPTRGYHETITRAYVELLAVYLGRFPADTPLTARVAALLASPLAQREALFAFYDRARLLSPQARAAFVEPDLAPLDPLVLAPSGGEPAA